MTKTKKTAAAVCLLMLFLLLAYGLIRFVFTPSQMRLVTSPPPEAQTDAGYAAALGNTAGSPNDADKMYVVRDIDGKIAVFDEESPEAPIMTTDTQTVTLRLNDREQIENGITVYGYENLLKLLEDFGS